MPQPPILTPTPDSAVGLQCPYCHTPLGAGEAAALCGDCTTGHHQECWTENQGCAVPGCESGPDPLAAATSAPAAGGAAATGAAAGTLAPPGRISIPVEDGTRRGGIGRRSAPQASVPAGLPPRPKRSRRGLAIGGVLVLLIAAAVGVLLSSSRPSTGAADSSTACSSSPGSCTDLRVGGTAHSLTEDEVKQDVQELIRSYYGALALGTDDGLARARTMLSASEKTRLDSDEAAQAQWEREAAQIHQELENPSAATVDDLVNRIGRSQETGVARVEVSGMGWSGTSCSNGKFSGVTWAQHEGDAATGTWRLDPDPSSRLDSVKAADVLGARCLGTAE